MHILNSILCADSHSDTDYRRMQSHLMRLAMEPTHQRSQGDSDRLWFYFRLFEERNDDPCTWRGFECTDGEVQALIFRQMFQKNTDTHTFFGHDFYQLWIVDMQWLPSTVREIFFDHIDLLDGWRASALPRDLRCMHLRFCSSRRLMNAAQDRHIDFCKLPQRIEELVLHRGWWAGPIAISELPATMRLCYIASNSIPSMVVDNAKLPAELESLIVFSNSKLFTAKEMNGHCLDDRIHVADARFAWQRVNDLSRYVARLEAVAAEIEAGNKARDIPGFGEGDVDV